MYNDTIKLLNLEDINADFEKSDVVKINNVLYCNIVLTTINEHCPECGSTEYSIKDYREKHVNHSISTASLCIIKYKARRYKLICLSSRFRCLLSFLFYITNDYAYQMINRKYNDR